MTIPSHTYYVQPEQVERVTIAHVMRIQRATPKPKPTPKPVVRAKAVAETHFKPRTVSPAAPSQKQHVKRVASARPKVQTRYHSKPAVVHVPVGGQGAGTSVTAKVETGGAGTGGTGTGESGSGQGTGGAPAAHEPCGYVDFAPNNNPTTDSRTGRVWEYVSLIVHFPDGSEQSVTLDYPFFYSSQAEDPFIKGHENIPATFQFPPPNQAPNEPALVQYVIKHTTPDGYTLLRDCPRSS